MLQDSQSVTISVKGRFHAFDLARELYRRNALKLLVTTYPKFKIREWEIPDNLSSTIVGIEVLSRVAERIPLGRKLNGLSEVALATIYGRLAATRIPDDTRLFVGWSGFSIESIRRAKAIGARTILDRGAAHILIQNQLLADEYARLGLHWPGVPSGMIDRELQEYKEADFICVPSNFVRNTFLQSGFPAHKILMVWLGCDLSIFKPKPKRDGIFRIVYCGQISIQKGVHLLIKAFNELKLKKAELWLIGGLTPELEVILRAVATPQIHLKGPIPRRLLPEYFSQGSLFCIPSIQDGFSMVVPQAMSCGLPVIVSTNTGASEIVAEGVTGFVIPAGDVEKLKEKLLLLYTNDAIRREMAANVESIREKNLSWARYGEQIIQAYQGAIGASIPGMDFESTTPQKAQILKDCRGHRL